MDARSSLRAALVLGFLALALTRSADAASSRTQHFVVTAPNVELARQVAETAERCRQQLAIDWLGKELPPWRDVCPIQVNLARGAGGETRFEFQHGQPGKWRMIVQGPPDRILDSVVPHEVLHMVFATHFGQGLPRWADEGACTTVEHISERSKQEHLLYECLTTNRGIPFNKMFAMREYPKDMLPLYAQGYSVARFLIAVGGKRRYVDFIGEGLRTNNWTAATKGHYQFESLAQLQTHWLEWVRQGGREEFASRYFVRPLEPLANENLVAQNSGPAAGAIATSAGNGAADDTPQEARVATIEMPRTLPPASPPPFDILPPTSAASLANRSQAPNAANLSNASLAPNTAGAVANTSPLAAAPAGRLAPVPSTAELMAAAATPGRSPAPRNSTSQVAAATPSANGSWYAQQRDDYRAGRSPNVPSDTAVARPQPIEKAREVVIESSRPAGALYGTPLPGTTVPGNVTPAPRQANPATAYAPGSTGGRMLR